MSKAASGGASPASADHEMPRAENDPLFQAARNAGMRLVDTRNEQTAAYIAESSGRLTGRLGVCAVSSGVSDHAEDSIVRTVVLTLPPEA